MAKNIHLKGLNSDFLYHFGLEIKTTNFKEIFSNVKFVCVAGSASRITAFAEHLAKEAAITQPPSNLAGPGARFVLYKIGRVLAADHGMGTPSLSICLNELIKLLHYADCENVTFLRIGSSGGIGLPPGSLVITTDALNTQLKPEYEMIILGKSIKWKPHLDEDLYKALFSVAEKLKLKNRVIMGKTVCADGFYLEQGRIDGAFCSYTEEDKLAYLRKAEALGVRNFEMECTCFGALCHQAGHRAGIVCVTLVNRLESDQVKISPEEYVKLSNLPGELVMAFLKNQKAI